MLKIPTVFILGAGASEPYGYPSGIRLVDSIKKGLLNKESLYGWCKSLDFNQDEIISFAEALKFSNDYSIDAFLERNPKFMNIGKVAIALKLLIQENEEVLFSVGAETWYGDLINGLKRYPLCPIKNISFITFNYDRSLEHYLFRTFTNSYEELSEKNCIELLKTIPVIHLHGYLGKLPWQTDAGTGRPYNAVFPEMKILFEASTGSVDTLKLSRTVHCIRNISQQIKIIHEADVDKDPEFKEAHQLLEKAHKIYFLGVGYNDDNLRRLKIAELSLNLRELTPSGYNVATRIISGTSVGIGKAKKRHIRSVTNNRINLPDTEYKIKEFIKEEIFLE